MEPGRDIVIHNSFDGKDRRSTCKPIGQMHFECDNNTWHIHQFAEVMARNGHTYEPAEPISDLTLFAHKYLDRDLTGEDGKPIPYRMIWCNNGSFLNGENWLDREMPPEERFAFFINPDAQPERQACLVDGNFEKEFMPLDELTDIMGIYGLLPFEEKQVMHSVIQAERQSAQREAASFEDKIQDAQTRAGAVSRDSTAKTLENDKVR